MAIAEQKRKKPILTEDDFYEIAEVIQESYQNELEIRLEVFDPYGNKQIIGKVTKLDQLQAKIRITDKWISFTNIIAADLL